MIKNLKTKTLKTEIRISACRHVSVSAFCLYLLAFQLSLFQLFSASLSDTLAYKGWMSQRHGVTTTNSGLAVDTFLDFHGLALNSTLTLTDVRGGSYGDTNGWGYLGNVTNYPWSTFKGAYGPSFPLIEPITVGGQNFTTTGTNWIQVDTLAAAVAQQENIVYRYAANIARTEVRWVQAAFITNGANDINIDASQIYPNPFSVFEMHFNGSQPANTPFNGKIHGANESGGSYIGSPFDMSPQGQRYFIEQLVDNTNSFTYIKFYNATNSAWMWTSVFYDWGTNSYNDNFNLANWVYINLGGLTGVVQMAGISVNTSPSTNRAPWVLAAPLNASSTQISGDRQVKVSFFDTNFMFAGYQVELSSNSVDWINSGVGIALPTNVFSWPADKEVTVTNLTVGTNYSFRVRAWTPLPSHSTRTYSAYASAGSVTITSTPVAFWVTNFNSALVDSTHDQTSGQFNSQQFLTNTVSGTCSKVRINFAQVNFAGQDMKVALVDAASNVVTSASFTVPQSTVGDYEITIPTVSVTAQIYRLAWVANVGGGTVLYGTKSGTTGGFVSVNYPGFDYASFPENPMSAPIYTDQTSPAGMLVQP